MPLDYHGNNTQSKRICQTRMFHMTFCDRTASTLHRWRAYCACLRNDSISSEYNPAFSLDSAPQNYDRLDTMRKAWVYKRKNVKGWWAGWYESGKRKAKALPSKALAEHFRQMKNT